LGQHRIGQRPGDPDTRVVPANTARQLSEVELGHLIEDLATIRQALEAMSYAARHVESAAGLARTVKSFPFAKSGRVSAHVHQSIENGAGGAADEFDFGFGLGLEVHAAEHAALLR